jgi:hypothetical protein
VRLQIHSSTNDCWSLRRVDGKVDEKVEEKVWRRNAARSGDVEAVAVAAAAWLEPRSELIVDRVRRMPNASRRRRVGAAAP